MSKRNIGSFDSEYCECLSYCKSALGTKAELFYYLIYRYRCRKNNLAVTLILFTPSFFFLFGCSFNLTAQTTYVLPLRRVMIQKLSCLIFHAQSDSNYCLHYVGLDQVAPGDIVEISGIFLPIPYTGFRALRAGLVADTFLEAMSITHFKKKYEE